MKVTLNAPGNINAAHKAFLKNINGEIIGECMDTPNNIAYAFSVIPSATSVDTYFQGNYPKEGFIQRIKTALSDKDYHSKYVIIY